MQENTYFTYVRYIGEFNNADTSKAFADRLSTLRAECAGLWVSVGQTNTGFKEILAAGDETIRSKLETLLDDFGLHWKHVSVIPKQLYNKDGSADLGAVNEYLAQAGGFAVN